MKKFWWLLLVVASSGFARETLTNAAVFRRCYAQLTQTRLSDDDPLLADVMAGRKTPVAACMEVFDKAKLNSNGVIAATNEVGKNVLRTMHKLHASWFTERDFQAIGINQSQMTQDTYDIETPALYFTRALFQPGVPFKYVVTANKHLRPVRTDNDPDTGLFSGRPKSQYIFDSNFKLAGVGELLGVQEFGPMPTNYSWQPSQTVLTGTVEIGKHFGGGILGSTPYLLMNVLESPTFKSNGAEAMPRKWARNAFSDLLCRSLPVVRYADVSAFRVPSSTVPFRQTQGCVQCHASMDRFAASIRGVGYFNIGNVVTSTPGGGFPKFLTPTSTSGTEWPSAPDANYATKQPDGVFYFRNYKGTLRDISFRGLTELGTTLSGEEDLYVCAAKRYYAYFMGVDVPIGDPQGAPALTAAEAAQKKTVEDLGVALKGDSDQSVREMIQKIFALPAYKQSDFRP